MCEVGGAIAAFREESGKGSEGLIGPQEEESGRKDVLSGGHNVGKAVRWHRADIFLAVLSDVLSPRRHGEDMIVTPFAQVGARSSPFLREASR